MAKSCEDKKDVRNPMEILEDALFLCRFGRFHYRLMIATLVAVLATTAVTTTTSYILSSAECDLHMNMVQKGLANAIPFLGQTCASLFTGFICDAFGRRISLAGGNLLLFACAVFGASSQSYWMIIVGKLLEGILMSLVFAATPAMVSEFTHKDVRDRILMLYSSFMSMAIIIAALLAWGILPLPINLVIVEGYFTIRSWNLFLYVSALWSLMASIMYWYLPESPKFLLSHGQENEALDVLKEVYKTNTRNEKDSFPITSLSVSGLYTPTVKTSFKKQITSGLFEIKVLFSGQHLIWLFLFSMTTFVCLLAYSALRLWYPQLSAIIENYKNYHNETSIEFCAIIEDYYSRHAANVSDLEDISVSSICVPELAGAETYTNGIILGLASLICIGVSGYLVDYFGQKPLMFIFLILCASCSGSLYFTKSSIQIAILVSATCGFIQAAFSLQSNIMVRVFPTTVRTLTMSFVVMMGRIGSLIGNIVFPMMLEMGCMAPFLTLSGVTTGSAALVYFLPNPRKENKTGDK